ncbi:ribonuclease H-like domain-containing protein [Nemania abortiva]|nr:ribonuclease H-like domain-containing protein [Nemania abortiva]
MFSSPRDPTETIVDTPKGVADLVDLVERQDTKLGDQQPTLYIDIEGKQPSRFGTISLLTVLIYPGSGPQEYYIVDIHTLGSTSFSTIGSCGKSLRDVLESPRILKVFFDVRNDADALRAHYGVELQGVLDVQVMEVACRPRIDHERYTYNLSRCMGGILSDLEQAHWKRHKEIGERLWNPQKGGSYDVFNARPLSKGIIQSCVTDVQYLPRLYKKCWREPAGWRKLIAQESQQRVYRSRAVDYQPDGTGRMLTPWWLVFDRIFDSADREIN